MRWNHKEFIEPARTDRGVLQPTRQSGRNVDMGKSQFRPYEISYHIERSCVAGSAKSNFASLGGLAICIPELRRDPSAFAVLI
jgi:hypothetical protein